MDDIELQCPHCRGLIGITDEGQVLALEEPKPLKENERIGVGGLRTVHSGDPRFLEYEPKRERKPLLQPLHTQKAGRQQPVEPDPAPVSSSDDASVTPFEPDPKLMEAVDKDLANRNIIPSKKREPRTKKPD